MRRVLILGFDEPLRSYSMLLRDFFYIQHHSTYLDLYDAYICNEQTYLNIPEDHYYRTLFIGSHQDIQKFYTLSFFDYLRTPYTQDDLHFKILKICNNSEINKDRMEYSFLTNSEKKIYYYLSKRKKNIVNHQELLEYCNISNKKSLSRSICSLRKKLLKINKYSRYDILSVKNIGYIFIEI